MKPSASFVNWIVRMRLVWKQAPENDFRGWEGTLDSLKLSQLERDLVRGPLDGIQLVVALDVAPRVRFRPKRVLVDDEVPHGHVVGVPRSLEPACLRHLEDCLAGKCVHRHLRWPWREFGGWRCGAVAQGPTGVGVEGPAGGGGRMLQIPPVSSVSVLSAPHSARNNRRSGRIALRDARPAQLAAFRPASVSRAVSEPSLGVPKVTIEADPCWVARCRGPVPTGRRGRPWSVRPE